MRDIGRDEGRHQPGENGAMILFDNIEMTEEAHGPRGSLRVFSRCGKFRRELSPMELHRSGGLCCPPSSGHPEDSSFRVTSVDVDNPVLLGYS